MQHVIGYPLGGGVFRVFNRYVRPGSGPDATVAAANSAAAQFARLLVASIWLFWAVGVPPHAAHRLAVRDGAAATAPVWSSGEVPSTAIAEDRVAALTLRPPSNTAVPVHPSVRDVLGLRAQRRLVRA